MKAIKYFLYATSIILLSACGGGGGSEVSINWPGTWYANFSVTKDPCGLVSYIRNFGDLTLLINQDGTNITAQNLSTNAVFTGGTVDNGNGFVVSSASSQTIRCSDGSYSALTVSMFFVKAGRDEAQTQLEITSGCNSTCDFVATGTAVKV